jgi:hypothetical protein
MSHIYLKSRSIANPPFCAITVQTTNMQLHKRAWQRVSTVSKPLLGQIARQRQNVERNRHPLLPTKPLEAFKTHCRAVSSRRKVAMVTASRSQPPRKQQPWGTRLAAVAVGLSLLVTLPWEKLDHEFAYDTSEVPDAGPQDKPRCVCCVTTRQQLLQGHFAEQFNPVHFPHVSAVNSCPCDAASK